MNWECRERIKRNLIKQLMEKKLFFSPYFEFLIRKENEYIGYVSERDGSNESIVIFNDEIKIIPIDEIIVTCDHLTILEGCFETYLFSKLSSGYEIIDIHEQQHQYLWDFIYEFNEITELYEYGVIKYLSFCKSAGITYAYMKFYKGTKYNLYEKYHLVCPIHLALNDIRKGYLCSE